MPYADKILIDAAKTDKNNFNKLYEKYYQKVYNYFWFRNGHNREAAEDLMQETFIRAFNDLDNYEWRQCTYLTYLLTIAHNLLANYFRDNSRKKNVELTENIPEYIREKLDNVLDAEMLWKKIYDLSPTERDVILLKYRRQLSIKEIAMVIGKSENAVKLILSRSRQKIRDISPPQELKRLRPHKKRYVEPEFLNEETI